MERRKQLPGFAGSYILLSALILSVSLHLTGCNDDEEEVETLAGIYAMQQVKVTEDFTIDGQVIIPANTDITTISTAGILDAAPCTDPSNAAVDLRASNELYLTCVGEEGEEPAGSWIENADLTKLTLILSSPPFTMELTLIVNDIARTDDSITGIINSLTLSGDAITPFLPDGMTAPGFVIINNVQVTFQKVG